MNPLVGLRVLDETNKAGLGHTPYGYNVTPNCILNVHLLRSS